jgi:protein-tyrosine-phosphatase
MLIAGLISGVIVERAALLIVIQLIIRIALYWHCPTIDQMISIRMNKNPIILFVCEHGAAKSILAAAYFNRLASERGLILRAEARGTNPDPELSPQTVTGLSEDGLVPTESAPQKLAAADIQSAQRVITFCELPVEPGGSVRMEYWNDVPPVSESYEKARDAILERIQIMLNT